MINFFSIAGLGLISAIFVTILKPMKSEYSNLLILITGIIMMYWVVDSLAPILDLMHKLSMNMQISGAYLEVIIKVLGIAFITRLAVDCCKDVGQTAIGSNIEMCGRIAILLMITPLFVEVIEIINAGLSI